MKMKFVATVALAVIGVTGLASTAWAQGVLHRDHFLTFDAPIALPNGVTLPAGRYLFRFPTALQATGRHDLTQILSDDQSTVFATLFTIPVERTASDRFEVTLTEASVNTPPTLKAWFCDRGTAGHEFVSVVAR
jgi:hypothetical protein